MTRNFQNMNKTGQNIVERENLPRNIQRLAAQKELYFRAKQLFFLQLILTIFVTILLTFVSFILSYFDYTIDWFRSFYGIAVTLADLFLINKFINKFRQKAASIQEVFDCDVLDLERNKILVTEEPISEEIKKYSDKHLKRVKNFDKLKNWYAETIRSVDGNAAKIICQRSNFSYDYAIRNSFLYWVVGISLTILVLLILIAVIRDFSLRSFLLTVILPFMPVLTLSVKLFNDHNSSIKNLESLKSNLKTIWSDVLNKTVTNPEKTIRQIQDKIYLNRKSNPLIPEKIYDYLRPQLEEQMYYCVDELVDEYKESGNDPAVQNIK